MGYESFCFFGFLICGKEGTLYIDLTVFWKFLKKLCLSATFLSKLSLHGEQRWEWRSICLF